MPNVFDYALSSAKSDWMDVFLSATSRFCIATASGFFRIPRYFNVPVIFTNSTSTNVYYSLKENDIFLPRLLKHNKNDKYMSFEEIMSPPVSMLCLPYH